MENEVQPYSDKELDSILGTNLPSYENYKVVSVDNGTDLVGTGATGEFIIKKYNQEDGTVERIPYAKEFSGVILASKSQLVDKGRQPTWRTNEFDATNKAELINVMPLANGKVRKNQETGEIVAEQMTYDEIKRTRQVSQPDGTKQSTYNYFVILYVGVGEEIIKLKFKGTSRGNFFDYSKSVAAMKAPLHNIITLFSTYIDKTTGKYAIKFDTALNPKGFPKAADASQVREQRVKVADSLLQNKITKIASPNQQTLIEEGSPQDKIDEAVAEEKEVQLSDLNF